MREYYKTLENYDLQILPIQKKSIRGGMWYSIFKQSWNFHTKK